MEREDSIPHGTHILKYLSHGQIAEEVNVLILIFHLLHCWVGRIINSQSQNNLNKT